MDSFEARVAYYARRYLRTERALKAWNGELAQRNDFPSIVFTCICLLELEEVASDVETAILEESRT